MEKKNVLTKVLAIAGTILVWFPILAPILLTVGFFIAERKFLFDYLMPMELFLFAIVGSGLLLWAALRAHSRVKWVAWGIGIAVCMFIGVGWFAEVTGMASGKTEPVGWMWGIAITLLIIFVLANITIGTGGVLLLRDLFKRKLSPS